MPFWNIIAGGLPQLKAMLIMLVVIAGAASAAYAYHQIQMWKKEATINELRLETQRLQADIDTLKGNISVYQDAATKNQQVITSLREKLTTQAQQAQTLTSRVQSLSREKDQYLSVFRRHDLTALSLAKPELVENRINTATQNLFRTLEQETGAK